MVSLFEWRRESTEAKQRTDVDVKIASANVFEKKEPADVQDYYGNNEGIVRYALSIVSDCVARLERSRSSSDAGDRIASDNEALHAGAGALECYFMKGMGDGWKSVTAAVHAACSLHDEPLTQDQLAQLATTLRMLAREPFLSSEKAMDLLEQLADVDVNIFPPELSAIEDLADG